MSLKLKYMPTCQRRFKELGRNNGHTLRKQGKRVNQLILVGKSRTNCILKGVLLLLEMLPLIYQVYDLIGCSF